MRNIDFNKYQSALIIGNGFDLSLGLSTSYMDFVNSDEFQILLNMQNQLAIYLKVNAELQSWKTDNVSLIQRTRLLLFLALMDGTTLLGISTN